jgi:hypothetical protein
VLEENILDKGLKVTKNVVTCEMLRPLYLSGKSIMSFEAICIGEIRLCKDLKLC